MSSREINSLSIPYTPSTVPCERITRTKALQAEWSLELSSSSFSRICYTETNIYTTLCQTWKLKTTRIIVIISIIIHAFKVTSCGTCSNHVTVLVWYSIVQQGLTSHSTHYRSFRTQFYGSYKPTNSITALKTTVSQGQIKG